MSEEKSKMNHLWNIREIETGQIDDGVCMAYELINFGLLQTDVQFMTEKFNANPIKVELADRMQRNQRSSIMNIHS